VQEDSAEGGQFHGQVIRRRKLSQAIFVQTAPSADAWVTKPSHAHAHPFFWILLSGDCAEAIEGRHRRTYRPLEATFHPRWEVHTHESGPRPPEGIGLILPGLEDSDRFRRGQILRGERTQGLVQRLWLEAWTNDSAAALSLDAITHELLGQLGNAPLPTSGRPTWLRLALERLHDGLPDVPKLEDLAKDVGVHPAYFCSEFRRRVGCSPGEYLRELRLRNACRQLAKTETPIGELAAEAGFFDAAHFCRRFRRMVGVSPSDFRSRARSQPHPFP